MSADPVLWDLDARGVATVTLNRPEVNNAYDGALIQGVLEAMDELGKKPTLRVVVLKGNGRHFQAGADLKWINSVRPKSPAENEAASKATFEAVQRLNRLSIPTVALVQGGCFGGGTGVISACDVVIAADNALFSITEVRWGLTAAIIIPQLCDAIGVRQVRRYALTGERFGAEEARRIGLVHEVVPLAELEAAGAKVAEQLLANAPDALAETKALAMDICMEPAEIGDAGGRAHAAEKTVALDQQRTAPGTRSGNSRRNAGWSATEDGNVIFAVDGNPARGFFDGFAGQVLFPGGSRFAATPIAGALFGKGGQPFGSLLGLAPRRMQLHQTLVGRIVDGHAAERAFHGERLGFGQRVRRVGE